MSENTFDSTKKLGYNNNSNNNSSTNNNNDIWAKIDEVRRKSQKFIKLQDGQKKVLQFIPNKIDIQETEFEGKKTGGYTILYTVIGPEVPETEKILSVSAIKSEPIEARLKKGQFMLEIEKVGAGKNSRLIAIPA